MPPGSVFSILVCELSWHHQTFCLQKECEGMPPWGATSAVSVYVVRCLALKYIVIHTGTMETKPSYKYNYLCIKSMYDMLE